MMILVLSDLTDQPAGLRWLHTVAFKHFDKERTVPGIVTWVVLHAGPTGGRGARARDGV